MAERTTRVFRSLTIYLLFCLLAVQLAGRNITNIGENRNLLTLTVSWDCNQAKIDTLQIRTKSNPKDHSNMAPALKTVVVVRLLNITLAANLIVLSNDVSLNPGPAITLPARTKGLRIFHLNIHSLRYKLDELRLFCDKHKPHILALNETWLDESFTDEELSLQGYNIMRRDRNRDGGGVAVYIAEHPNYSRL